MYILLSNIEYLTSLFFAIGILHTFFSGLFFRFSHKLKQDGILKQTTHLLGEAEVPLGLWASLLCLSILLLRGKETFIHFINQTNFVEPLFVFTILCVTSSKPILKITDWLIFYCSRLIPLPHTAKVFASAMTIGPIMGSFITEPAAMTVSALFLRRHFFSRIHIHSESFKYLSLGLLFTNISIGGAMTHFAAPPILVVAEKYKWNFNYVFQHFAWKIILIIFISTALFIIIFWKPVFASKKYTEHFHHPKSQQHKSPPFWVAIGQIIFLLGIVVFNHHPKIFLSIFILFLGWYQITKHYQDPINVHTPLLIMFFLGGLMLMGKQQAWWISPILTQLNHPGLFLISMILSAFNDNAAVTYLSSFIEEFDDHKRYLIVAGALAGGGLTVIANAPNPIGIGILRRIFAKDYGLVQDVAYNPEAHVNPLKLAAGALPWLIIASVFLYIYP